MPLQRSSVRMSCVAEVLSVCLLSRWLWTVTLTVAVGSRSGWVYDVTVSRHSMAHHGRKARTMLGKKSRAGIYRRDGAVLLKIWRKRTGLEGLNEGSMRAKHRKLLSAAKKWMHGKWKRHDFFPVHNIVQGRHTSSPACYVQVHLIQSLIGHACSWCCSREAAPAILSRILTPVPLLPTLRDFHRKYREQSRRRDCGTAADRQALGVVAGHRWLFLGETQQLLPDGLDERGRRMSRRRGLEGRRWGQIAHTRGVYVYGGSRRLLDNTSWCLEDRVWVVKTIQELKAEGMESSRERRQKKD